MIDFIDQCINTVCEFNSKCTTTVDGVANCVCPICNNEYDLVCGNDGVNYASQCWMEREGCLKSKSINVAKKGACGKCVS